MFIADKLIYIDLHKTACSHIRKMLSHTIGGELIGKHNRIDAIDRSKFIIGSIRNPWDWYLSLWAFGCKHQGAIYGRTTKSLDIDCYFSGLQREMSLSHTPWLAVFKTMLSDISKPTKTWQKLYSDPENAEHFKEWLFLMYDHNRKYDLGEGYGFSPISCHSGLYTYRYLKLYSVDISHFYNSDSELSTYSGMEKYDSAQNMLNATIRNENLEEDLISALQSAGYILNDAQVQFIFNGKVNKTNSSEHRERTYYFDETSINMIHEREKLIINKYGYDYSAKKM